MAYNEKYISKEMYDNAYVGMNMLYEGFVIGYGYAYTKAIVVQPSHWNGYNPTGRVYGAASHSCMIRVQMFDYSEEAIKLSKRGLFKNNVVVISVTEGMTLSHIAKYFDIPLDYLVSWNNIDNPNHLYIRQ